MEFILDAYRLADIGCSFEEESKLKRQQGDIEGAQRGIRLAIENYSRSVEIFLQHQKKFRDRSYKTIRDTVSLVLTRLEILTNNNNVAADHPQTKDEKNSNMVVSQEVNIDPIKDEKRKKVAEEIFDTERRYVQGLRDMLNYYVIPFRKHGILTLEEEGIVFAGFNEILGLSEELLKSLEKKIPEWDYRKSTLGDLFSLYAEFFKLYIPYSNNYSRGEIILKQKNYSFINDDAISKGMMQSFSSLKILPIQRIPRYVLLLQELQKRTNETHLDYEMTQKALDKIKLVAKQINAKMTSSEMEAKVLEIQTSLWTATGTIPDLISPGRTFVKEGPVAKLRTSGTLKRNFYLFCFNDIVVYATTNPLFKNKYHFHKALDYYGAFPADEEARQLGANLNFGECAFKVTGSNGYRIFVVSTDSERREWLSALTTSAGAKEERRKSLSKARGEMLFDEDDDDED